MIMMVDLNKLSLRLARNIPVIHVFLCAYSAYSPLNWFDASNTVGHSLFVCLFYFIVCIKIKEFRQYRYPLVFTIGMAFMSFVDWYGNLFNYDNFKIIYDVGALMVCVFLSVLLILFRDKSIIIKKHK